MIGVVARLHLAGALYRLGRWIAGGDQRPKRPKRRRPRIDLQLSPETYRERMAGIDPREAPAGARAKLPYGDYAAIARLRHHRMPGREPRSEIAAWVRGDPDTDPRPDPD